MYVYNSKKSYKNIYRQQNVITNIVFDSIWTGPIFLHDVYQTIDSDFSCVRVDLNLYKVCSVVNFSFVEMLYFYKHNFVYVDYIGIESTNQSFKRSMVIKYRFTYSAEWIYIYTYIYLYFFD